ncbi:MAG: tRNA pseudouridine(38-40) synthase TruA [Eggerthellaceae bacterium]|jgi:tRNA pseudouridine38-40 synthase
MPQAADEMPGFVPEEPTGIQQDDGTVVPAVGQLAAVVSYDGASFAGFARQPGQETVQGRLEQAFSTALHRPVQMVCAGRTDAGVHALGQVISLPFAEGELDKRNLFRLRRSVNALSGEEIAIRSLTPMPLGFSARFSAYEREYRYFIVPGAIPPVFMRRYAWHVGSDLDAEAMDRAARLLVGEHDFNSFCLAVSARDRNTVRTLYELSIDPFSLFGESGLCVRVVGNAFLHSMIRAIVGTLVAVGRGRHEPEWVQEVLDARNRSAAGENAPASGLVFWHVGYRDGIPS